jgi:hypothetical protein
MKFAGVRLRLSASDVANFVACQHMTRLDLLEARGALRRPREFDLGFQDLVKRGEAHEQTVLDQFRVDGRSIAEIRPGPDADAAQPADRSVPGAGAALRELPVGRPVCGPPAARRRPVAGRRDHQRPAAGTEDRRGPGQARPGLPGRPSRRVTG